MKNADNLTTHVNQRSQIMKRTRTHRLSEWLIPAILVVATFALQIFTVATVQA